MKSLLQHFNIKPLNINQKAPEHQYVVMVVFMQPFIIKHSYSIIHKKFSCCMCSHTQAHIQLIRICMPNYLYMVSQYKYKRIPISNEALLCKNLGDNADSIRIT